jgi:hypothetical protein
MSHSHYVEGHLQKGCHPFQQQKVIVSQQHTPPIPRPVTILDF